MDPQPIEKKSLPLVPAKGKEAVIADAYALRRLVSMMRNPETAQYAYEKFAKSIQKVRENSQEYGEVLGEIKKYVDVVRSQDISATSPWNKLLDAALTRYETFHQNKALASIQSIIDKMEHLEAGETKHIRFDFAMSEEKGTTNEGKLLQGFSTQEGETLTPVDEDMEQQINDVYSQWLVSQSMVCTEEGVIIHADQDGEPATDSQGKQKPVDKGDYVKKFSDPEHGFSAFVSKATKGALKIDVFEQAFPAPESKPETASGSSSR